MKNYLLFDLDGTLTDSKEGICTCVQYALASFGIQEPDLDKLEPFIGPPLKDSFMKYYQMDEAQAQEAVEKYRERFRDTGIFENRLYEGIPEMLNALNGKGMFMAVASSKPTEYVRRILEHFKIAKYFKVIVGSEMDGTRTRKEEVIQEALRQLFGNWPIEKSKVYMIGDRCYDVEGARSVGLESVGVTYGYGDMEELKEARADYIVRSVEELRRFLLRGTEGTEKLTMSQRIWQMMLPFLMFLLVRNMVTYLLVVACASLGNSISGADFLFIRNEAGEPVAMTGNISLLISTLGYVAGAASILKIARKMLRKTEEDMKLLHIKAEPGRSYGFLGMATVGLVLGLNLLLELVGAIERSEAYQSVAEQQYSAWLPLGLICYGLITPVAEELLFRGTIYNCVRRYMKLPSAMLISAVFFGLYHGNSVQGIYAVILGYLMVYAYEYFGDFRIPVAIHMAANVIAYILGNVRGMTVLVNWPVCAVCLALGAGGALLLHKEKKIF